MSDDNQFASAVITPELGVDADTVIDLVRGTRLSILKEHTKQGVPVDKDSWMMMHQNLQELEKGAVTSKRLVQEEKNGETQAELSRQIAASIVAGMGGGRDIYAVKDATGTIPNPLAAIEGSATIIDGELDVGTFEDTYDEFQARVGSKLDEARRQAAADVPETD